jgi:hypothetical protein
MIEFPYITRGAGHAHFRGAIEDGRGFSFVTFLLPRQKKSKSTIVVKNLKLA